MTFDALAMTERLQAAVRDHDLAALDELVSDRFLFVCGHSIQRFGESGYDDMSGKNEWRDAAAAIAWEWFAVDLVRTLELGEVVVVDCRIRQRSRDGDDVMSSSWLILDVWAMEQQIWRLVTRHAEFAG